jgi:hypothetical protein
VERWFDRLQAILSGTPGIEWDIVSKQGSALTDIETRPHSDLQNVLGGSDQYHVQQTERAELVSLDALATGMVAKTADAEYAARTILGTTGKVDVSNGNGTAGDPAVTLPSVITGPQKFGTETNYTEFEEDGTLIFNGAATVWEDDNFAAVALGIGASPPDLIAFDGGAIQVRAFDGNAITEQLFGGAEYKHSAKEGANIQFHLHWCPTTNNAGNVKWQLAYRWINVNDLTAGSDTVISVTQAASGVAWQPHKVAFPTVSGAGKTFGSQIGVRIFRDPIDAADTYPDDAAIPFTFGYHYEIDTIGSRQITTK